MASSALNVLFVLSAAGHACAVRPQGIAALRARTVPAGASTTAAGERSVREIRAGASTAAIKLPGRSRGPPAPWPLSMTERRGGFRHSLGGVARGPRSVEVGGLSSRTRQLGGGLAFSHWTLGAFGIMVMVGIHQRGFNADPARARKIRRNFLGGRTDQVRLIRAALNAISSVKKRDVALRATGDGNASDDVSGGAGALDEAEKIFKEAYDAEVERWRLLKQQLEMRLGDGVQVESAEVATPLTDSSTTWRKAFDAIKLRAEKIEQQLQAPAGASVGDAAASPASAADSASDAGATAAVASAAPAVAEASAEVSPEAEALFKEAFEAERQRSKLLQNQLEAALAEKLGSAGISISVNSTEVKSPEEGGALSWREAYDAAKMRTQELEGELNKARGIGASQAPPPASSASPSADVGGSTSASTTGQSEAAKAGLSKEEAEQLRNIGVADDQFKEVKNIRDLADLAADEETVLRLVSAAVLPEGSFLGEQSEQPDSLPPVTATQEALVADGGKDFIVSGGAPLTFQRCYVFKGNVPQGRDKVEALASMQKRVIDTSPFGTPELYLQPSKEEGKSLLIVLLDSDLPKREMEGWQWVAFVILLLISLVAANSTAFAVLPQKLIIDPTDAKTITKVGLACLPIAGALLGTIAASEAARRVAAAKYGVELSPPYLVPTGPLASTGILGAVTRRLTPVPSKEAEFAMSSQAALVGYVVSIGFLFAGLALGPDKDFTLNLSYQLLPLLLKVILKPLLGAPSITQSLDPFADPTIFAFAANPLAIGGVVGILVTSLSLLPIGRLDGGIISRLTLGNSRGVLSFLALLMLLLGSGAADESGALYLAFGISTLVLNGGGELPPKEDTEDLSGGEKALGVGLLAIGLLLCLPGWPFPNV